MAKFGLCDLDVSATDFNLDTTIQSTGSLWRTYIRIGHSSTKLITDNPKEMVMVSQNEVVADEKDELGRGAGGYVLRGQISESAKCSDVAGKEVAVKVVYVGDKDTREQLVNEVALLLRLSQASNHLINCYGAFTTPSNFVHVVLEYMDWSLAAVRDKGAPVPARVLPLILVQVLDGFAVLHLANICHRDVKCGNILVNTQGEVKVSDYGISKDELDMSGACTSFLGTMSHMSPERLMGEPYGKPSDIWSVGVVAYELAVGVYPYGEVKTFPALCNKICNAPDPVPVPPENLATSELSSFLFDCMQKETQKRKKAEVLLNHALILSNDAVNNPDQTCMELRYWLEDTMAVISGGCSPGGIRNDSLR